MRSGDLSSTCSIQEGSGWLHFKESLPEWRVVRLSIHLRLLPYHHAQRLDLFW